MDILQQYSIKRNFYPIFANCYEYEALLLRYFRARKSLLPTLFCYVL